MIDFSVKLKRGERTKIFDYDTFIQSRAQGHNLHPDVYIGFGQKWNFGSEPDGVLVVARVVSSMAFAYNLK